MYTNVKRNRGVGGGMQMQAAYVAIHHGGRMVAVVNRLCILMSFYTHCFTAVRFTGYFILVSLLYLNDRE